MLRSRRSHDHSSALSLADEYGIKLWIAALLDPEPITHGTSDPKKSITSPPTFRIKDPVNGLGRSPEKPTDGRRSTRGRSLRSASPMKKETPARKFATPRKARKGRAAAKLEEEAAAIAEEAAESINGDLATATARESTENVKVEVENTTQPSPGAEGEEIEKTKVNIEMPAGLPELELPNDAQAMLAEARAMVHEAEKIGGPSGKAKGKRKAEEMIEDEEEETEQLPPKRVKAVQTELRKEKIKRRAITGIAAGLALG